MQIPQPLFGIALEKLTHLSLSSNQIGSDGMVAFAEAVGSGALPQLKELGIFNNLIGDIGMQSFAGAIGRGALPALKNVLVDDVEHPQLVAACQAGSNGCDRSK